MNAFSNNMARFFFNRRNLFIMGLLLTALVTFIEVNRWTQYNFFTFQYSTFDFWDGVDPYGLERNDFLYGPLFSILFAPFAWLGQVAGPFVWNLFNFTLYFIAIFTLPEKYTEVEKCKTYLYTALILATTQFSMQFNPVVAYIFVFAFSLLERGKGFWAVLLIMVSGFIKIYGIFELALLVCYPRFWRNLLYAVGIGVFFFLLPAVRLGFDGLIPHYERWFEILGAHVDQFQFYALFNIHPIHGILTPVMTEVQIGSLCLLAALFLLNYRKFGDFAFRAGSLGILMGWVILFSLSTEKHTYVIALLGFMLWYWMQPRKDWLMKTLFWSNFILLVIVPIDIIVPWDVMIFIVDKAQLNIYSFVITWFYMIYCTFLRGGFGGKVLEPAGANPGLT